VLAAAGTLCILYGYFIEPNRLTVTNHTIRSSKIPLGSAPIRVVHLTDIHSDKTPRLESMLPATIKALAPDLIVLTGDYVRRRSGPPVFRQFLSELSKIAPTFAVKGNWETDFYWEYELLKGTGAQELDGKAVRMEIHGAPIWVVGLSANNESALPRTLAAVPPNEFRLLLYHYPDILKEAAAQGVDLYLAGHTHGGQVALPFYGALVTFSKFDKRYESGLFQEGSTWMYVSRGIGLGGGLLPKFRFFAPPELAVFELRPAE
jgi:predicted MPP superfamily phosphohydrolase